MAGVLGDSFLNIWEPDVSTKGGGKEAPSEEVKSQEEIAAFTVDPRLSEVERTILFLNGGQAVQQQVAVRNLASVLKGRGRAAWDAIAPSLKAALGRMDLATQVLAAEVFVEMARERVMPAYDLQVCLLPIICRNINKEKSEEETEAWLQSLFALIPYLEKEVLKAEVVTLALSKGEVEESVSSRCICARILGAAAKGLSRDEVERTFLSQALLMCQDLDFHIRTTMCEQLVGIGRAVGGELLSRRVLDEALELLKDESVQVRVAALHALVQLLELLPADTRRSKVLPVLRQHMQPLDLAPALQLCLARNFGSMLTQVRNELEGSDDLRLFLGCFRHLLTSSSSSDQLRQACAQQLPAVIKAASALQPDVYASHFHDIVTLLLADSSAEVRSTVAGQLYEYTRVAGAQAANLLTRPLARVLRDLGGGGAPCVAAAAMPQLALTLGALAAAAPSDAKRESVMADVAKALAELDATVGARQWRLQQHLAQAFSAFPRVFGSDQVYEHFVPMALRMLAGSAAAVRPAAAEGLAVFLRYGRKEAQRAELYRRLLREFVRARCCTHRAAFSHVARHLLSTFSSRWIKEWLFDATLELLYDPVPNVRLQFSSLLPSLKQVIRLPEDVELLERLNNAMSNVMTDNDRDVSLTGRAVSDAFKRLPVRMGMGTQVVEVNGVLGAGAGFEALDRKKEEEEAELVGFTPEDAASLRNEIYSGLTRRKGGGSSSLSGSSDAAGASTATVARGPVPRRNSAIMAPSASHTASGQPRAAPGRTGMGSGGAGAGSGTGFSGRTNPTSNAGIAASAASGARPGGLAASSGPSVRPGGFSSASSTPSYSAPGVSRPGALSSLDPSPSKPGLSSAARVSLLSTSAAATSKGGPLSPHRSAPLPAPLPLGALSAGQARGAPGALRSSSGSTASGPLPQVGARGAMPTAASPIKRPVR